jgi:hypothetical protein
MPAIDMPATDDETYEVISHLGSIVDEVDRLTA